MPNVIAPPAGNEFAEFHRGYIAAVQGEEDGIAVLARQVHAIENLRRLTPAQAMFRYAEGKWTVKEVIGHLSDAERVVSYRLLCIARGDQTPLPRFDENAYGAASNADNRALGDLVDELAAVRAATLALVRAVPQSALANRGTVNEWSLTARGLVFIIAGHFAHHLNVLRDRYGIAV